MTAPTKPHLEALLQHDIDLIRTKILEMEVLAEQALTNALQSFLARDRQLAYSVILRDQMVDDLETELDQRCVEFIVRHQPAASHLRFVYSASKIIKELERVGDYAESIARQVLELADLEMEVDTDKFTEIANLSLPMLHNAVRAFVDKNADLARATIASDPRADQVRNTIVTDLVQARQENKIPLQALAPLMNVVRRLARVADQAINISEEALYFATGEYLKHRSHETFRIVFVDNHNASLSQMAESIGNQLKTGRFSFSSAGVIPTAVDARTIQFLLNKGIDISRNTAKSIDQIPNIGKVQVMVALSKDARQVLPRAPTKIVGLEWTVDDPSLIKGTPAQLNAAYEKAFEQLTNQIRDLVEAVIGNERT